MCAVCLALALTLCAVGVARAADQGLPGNYEDLKKLEPLIGTWTGQFVAPQDHPTANIKKGDQLTLTSTYKWDLNMSTVSNYQTIGVPGSGPIWQATFLIGWDTANKRIVCFAFESTGGHQVIDDWVIHSDKVTLKGKGSDPFGRKTNFTMIISDVKKDSCVREMIDITIDGTKQPDWAKLTMKRAQAK
jgi:hypothetical protein